mmetsp:Transcript_13038/g.17045  ORF Transcript_13038/g.17045 Transcript_13038/m.17045 type:complete len:86 (+) Transcript_13038:383-640(+)
MVDTGKQNGDLSKEPTLLKRNLPNLKSISLKISLKENYKKVALSSLSSNSSDSGVDLEQLFLKVLHKAYNQSLEILVSTMKLCLN